MRTTILLLLALVLTASCQIFKIGREPVPCTWRHFYKDRYDIDYTSVVFGGFREWSKGPSEGMYHNVKKVPYCIEYVVDTIRIEDPIVLEYIDNVYVTSRKTYESNMTDMSFFLRPDVFLFRRDRIGKDIYKRNRELFMSEEDFELVEESGIHIKEERTLVADKKSKGGFVRRELRDEKEMEKYWRSLSKREMYEKIVWLREFETKPDAFLLTLMNMDKYAGAFSFYISVSCDSKPSVFVRTLMKRDVPDDVGEFGCCLSSKSIFDYIKYPYQEATYCKVAYPLIRTSQNEGR